MLVDLSFFFKQNITLTLFEGLNSGTFTAEIIFKIVSSEKSCYGLKKKTPQKTKTKQFKFTSTQKGPHKKTVYPVAFQRIPNPKYPTNIQQ